VTYGANILGEFYWRNGRKKDGEPKRRLFFSGAIKP
jgi:hypothetical protein